eukprot:1081454-Pleurochrysis_carterae.AAC.3
MHRLDRPAYAVLEFVRLSRSLTVDRPVKYCHRQLLSTSGPNLAASPLRLALHAKPVQYAGNVGKHLHFTGGRNQQCSLSTMRDPYAVLGLPPHATREQIKLAYYQLAMRSHPDRSKVPGAANRFAEIGAAYNQLMGEAVNIISPAASEHAELLRPPADVRAFPDWVYDAADYLYRIGDRVDRWMIPTYPHIIYQHLRANELAEAFAAFEDMKEDDVKPTQAVYEMLIRGCTIAMRRVGPGQQPDHLTVNLLKKVKELWAEMEEKKLKADYWSYNELIRALGKAGAIPEMMQVFDKMCRNVRLLPEERAFNSMYEACVLSGHYSEALEVRRPPTLCRVFFGVGTGFAAQPSSALLLRCSSSTRRCASRSGARASIDSSDVPLRLQKLPRILELMGRQGVLPQTETCDRILATCIKYEQLPIAQKLLDFAQKVRQPMDLKLVHRAEKAIADEARRATADFPKKT